MSKVYLIYFFPILDLKCTGYHCKDCDAYHGHIFNAGLNPIGKRFCNKDGYLVFSGKLDEKKPFFYRKKLL